MYVGRCCIKPTSTCQYITKSNWYSTSHNNRIGAGKDLLINVSDIFNMVTNNLGWKRLMNYQKWSNNVDWSKKNA